MKCVRLSIPDLIVIEPQVYADDRGYFFESFNHDKFNQCVGSEINFVQDNESLSTQGVLRGLHYQIGRPQGKLVRVVSGEVFDVAVDIRRESSTFGQWAGVVLSGQNKKQLWIPEGFAHGFLVLSETATFNYKVTDYWSGKDERCIYYNDAEIGISWPEIRDKNNSLISVTLSEKDSVGKSLADADVF